MNVACRQELLRAIAELGAARPEVRLGQLVANLSYLARGPAQESVWDAEDEELLAAAHDLLKNYSQGCANPADKQVAKS